MWPYKEKNSYVITTQKHLNDSDVEFITDDIADFFTQLKKENGKDIWLVGGAMLINHFIKNDLIDEYIITIFPLILGSGIKLFADDNPERKLQKTSTQSFGDVVEVRYSRG